MTDGGKMCILLLPFCNSYFTIVIFSSEQEVITMNQVQDQSWTARLPIAELDQTGPIRQPKPPKAEPKKVQPPKEEAQTLSLIHI